MRKHYENGGTVSPENQSHGHSRQTTKFKHFKFKHFATLRWFMNMYRAWLLAVAILLLPSAAFAQSVGEKTGVNSALGIAPKTADFVKEAAISDMTEIEAAKIALQKGNADEKTFANQMITDHTETSNELKAMVTNGDVREPLPTALDSSSQKKIDKLNAAKPEDFSSEYDPLQVSAHEDAVSLFERYANGGDNPKLKDWAAKTLPTLKHHLEMAKSLPKSK